MPTQTFAHLPKEKQERILQAAKEEFSTYSFYDASINRIIKKAGISRGGFYLYFENKEDLLLFLLNRYKDELTEKIKGSLTKQKCDIFTLHLIIFDFIAAKVREEEHSAFLRNVLTTMDLRLANKLMHFMDQDETVEDPDQILSSIVVADTLNADPLKNDLYHMFSILKGIIFEQVITALKNPAKEELSREELLRKFELLKAGFLK